jgi:lysozyme family protein
VPWELIGALHYREAGWDFRGVLHNGDKIIGTGRKTYRVPKGRWPFNSWEEAAIDALKMIWSLGYSSLDWSDSQLRSVAGYAEKYNWMGYRNRGKVSPYVWSGTEKYTWGRFVADHVYNSSSYDSRPGVMPIIIDILKKNGSRAQNSH